MDDIIERLCSRIFPHPVFQSLDASLQRLSKEAIKLNILASNFYLVCIDSSRLSCLGAAPVFNPSSYSGTVDENVPTDTTVSGITLSASDTDGDNITYSIISSAGPFKLSADGLSVLTNGLVIDFESQNSYSLTVQAEAAGKHGNGPCRNKNFNFDLEELGCSVLVLCVTGLDKTCSLMPLFVENRTKKIHTMISERSRFY